MPEKKKNKYEALSVAQLRAIVKEHGIKNTSAMRKAQLVELVSGLGLETETAADGAAEKAAESAPKNAVKKTDKAAAAGQTRADRTSPAAPSEESQTSHRRISRGGYGEETEGQDNQGEHRAASRRHITQRDNAGRERPMQRRGDNTGRDRMARRAGDNSRRERLQGRPRRTYGKDEENTQNLQVQENVDPSLVADGILEVLPDGFGFIRSANYLSGDEDVYVSHAQIRRFNLKTGDIVHGTMRVRNEHEKFNALLRIEKINGFPPEEAQKRASFESMTPIFPNHKLNLETADSPLSMRMVNLISPIGRGQRGMIVSPPKTGKTTLIKQVAHALHTNYPSLNIIILLIDERPEEVTDIKEFIEGDSVEVIYSTFDELPEHHKRVAEMVLERAKRLVEHKQDVVILLDSITRLARAYNMTIAPSGRTLTGGLDPAALHMPKKFFGAARNMREGGSLTVLATALVDTGSKMDDVVFEEFKGTGNMELVLDRKLSEQRVFPAIDIAKSGTRREDLLLAPDELEAMYKIRKSLRGTKAEEATEMVMQMFRHTKNNAEFVAMVRRTRAL